MSFFFLAHPVYISGINFSESYIKYLILVLYCICNYSSTGFLFGSVISTSWMLTGSLWVPSVVLHTVNAILTPNTSFL